MKGLHRDDLQTEVGAWCRRTFGDGIMLDRHERALRVLEEAIELAQADGVALGDVMAVAGHVFAKPRGKPEKEIGQVGVALLAYAEAIGLSATDAEIAEAARVFMLPPEHWAERHDRKCEAGIARKREAA